MQVYFLTRFYAYSFEPLEFPSLSLLYANKIPTVEWQQPEALPGLRAGHQDMNRELGLWILRPNLWGEDKGSKWTWSLESVILFIIPPQSPPEGQGSKNSLTAGHRLVTRQGMAFHTCSHTLPSVSLLSSWSSTFFFIPFILNW